MAIEVGTTGNDTGAIVSTTVTVDSGSNRLVIAQIAQQRATSNLATPVTLNSVAPSGSLTSNFFTGASVTDSSLGIFYWTEADLPAAGSYTLAWSGSASNNRIVWANFTGVSDEVAEAASQYEGAQAPSHGTTVSPYTAGSLAIMGIHENGITSMSAGDGTLIAGSDARSGFVYRTDSASVSFNTTNIAVIGGWGAFKAAGGAATTLTLTDITPTKAKHGVTCSVSGDQLQSARFSWNLYSAGGNTVLASLSQSAVSQATTSANILVSLRDFPYTDLTGGNWRIALHASAASASADGEASAELSVAHTAEDVWIWSEYNGQTIPSSASAHSFWEGTTPTSGDQLRVLRALSGSAQFSELSADGTFVITSALSAAIVTAHPQEFSGSAFAWQASASVEINVAGQETQLAFSSAAAQSASYTQIYVHTVHTKDAEVMVLAQSTEPTTAEFEAVTQGTWASGVATVSGLATGSTYTVWVRISASGSAEVTSFPAFTSIDPLSVSAAFASADLSTIFVNVETSRTADIMVLSRAIGDPQPADEDFDAAVYGSALSLVATVSALATGSTYTIWVKTSAGNSSEVAFFNAQVSAPPPGPLAFLSGPVAQSASFTQIYVHAVATRSATLAVIAQTTASGQPATADFDAVAFSALSAVATLSGLATGSGYEVWVRLTDGTSTTFETFNAQTSAAVIVTASANAAIQSRTFTQVVFLLTPDSSAAVQYVQTTASAPQPSTATFELGSAGTLSATAVTATVSGLLTATPYRLWYRAVNADDEFISFLNFHTSAPIIEADSPARGNQIAVSRAFKISL